MQFTAHVRKTDKAVQTVGEHCRNVADLAEGYLEGVGLGKTGKLVGLMHDAGKLSVAFDDYINERSNAVRGSIDHSFAGARYLTDLCVDSDDEQKKAVISMAHVIMSHHGLCDWVDENCEDNFGRRVLKNDSYDEICGNISELIDGEDMEYLIKTASEEWLTSDTAAENKTEYAFYIGMLERLIQSALIDADRIDTADFMSAKETSPEPDYTALWSEMDRRMDEKLSGFEGCADRISLQRRSISDRCAAFAEHRVGACRLIVPTGGGKTLSSMRFAIKQCERFGLKRIFYIAPFMSILEQNSEIIADLAGKENFLEHHSNIVAQIDDENEYNAYQLSAERWDKPVIATTMVQFLNTLFSGKTSSVRRMHRFSEAVIIVDEAQSVPLRCTNLFALAVNFLTKVCGSTVVLCSATQPTFEQNNHRLILDENPDMITDHVSDFEIFRRTQIIPAIEKIGYDFDKAARFCCEKFDENGDLLLIVNTKAQALKMYELMKERMGERAYIIHLSTNMCPAHRKKRIGTLRRFLKRGLPVICITTQLIEAGVDISFRCVVRTLAGLDNAAQAAGRCNRSGEYGRLCPVYLINFNNKAENLGNLTVIKEGQQISRNILSRKEEFENILSVEAQSEFFRQLFNNNKDKLSYPIEKEGFTLLELLSLNERRREVRKKTYPELSQAFKTAGKYFEVIDSRTENVVVPYNKEAHEIILQMNGVLNPKDAIGLLRKAQKYTVSIYSGAGRKLADEGAIYTNANGVTVLDERFYSKEYGVTTNGAEREVLMY